MAVDQARHLNFLTDFNLLNNNFFTNIQAANTTSLNNNNDSNLFPFYNLNAVVQQQFSGTGKIFPAVKDDSGVTFNNSYVPPSSSSRKRQREEISCVAPSLLTMQPTTTSPNGDAKDSSRSFSFLGEDLSLQILQQQFELDRFVSHHMEKMKMEVEERKKRQTRRVMAVIEEALRRRLRYKDEEMEKIEKVNFALEERVKTLCIENQIWRDLAVSNEATANALRTNLHQVLQQVKDINNNGVDRELTDDAVSCCGSNGPDERENEELQKKKTTSVCDEDDRNGKSGGRICRECGIGESSVLVLPCRHLCLCTSCGPTVNACPICSSVKNASVHVNLS